MSEAQKALNNILDHIAPYIGLADDANTVRAALQKAEYKTAEDSVALIDYLKSENLKKQEMLNNQAQDACFGRNLRYFITSKDAEWIKKYLLSDPYPWSVK